MNTRDHKATEKNVMLFSPATSNNNHRWLLLAIVVLVFGGISAFVAIPKMLQIHEVGRETKAINSLMEIQRAQSKFYAAKNRYATLKELATDGLIRKEYASNKAIGGYRFTDSEITEKSFTIHAVRDDVSDGFRDFNVIESGEIFYLENRLSKGTFPRGQGVPFGE